MLALQLRVCREVNTNKELSLLNFVREESILFNCVFPVIEALIEAEDLFELLIWSIFFKVYGFLLLIQIGVENQASILSDN